MPVCFLFLMIFRFFKRFSLACLAGALFSFSDSETGPERENEEEETKKEGKKEKAFTV